jgi:hypothetical protein
MGRPGSERVEEVRRRLRARAVSPAQRPGDRFLSAREVARAFEVSYQTAHRLICELEGEGLLERRAGAGTFIPSGGAGAQRVLLAFSERARRPHSFGARLLGEIQARLDANRVPWKMRWVRGAPSASTSAPHSSSASTWLQPGFLPVLWEAPALRDECVRARRAGLLLNERPQPGLEASWFDSVSIDDFSGGACAAQLLLERESSSTEKGPRATRKYLCVLAGPSSDARAVARRDGFLTLCQKHPKARVQVLEARGWFFEDGRALAQEVVRAGSGGIFAGNDRLAHAVATWCDENTIQRPPLVGFDDAPVAQAEDLTTIAIPWGEVVGGAVEILKKRLGGDTGAPRQLIVTPRPIVRRL